MAADLFDALAAMTVAGSLAILGVLAARTVLRRWFGAQIAYAAWLAVPLVALVMLLPAPLLPVATMLRIAPAAAVHGAVAALPAVTDWRPAILVVWLLGVVATAAVFVLQQRRYLRSLGRLHALDGDGAPRILRAEAVDGGPALIGAWRPRIVLPGDFEARYAPRERELILAHEQIHLARGDARINALVAALRCLNWFNPLLHLAVARFRFDQELACDAAVIARFPQARRSYADAMLKTQLAGQARQELRLPVGCRWPSRHPLKERIAMLKQPLPTRARRVGGIALVALLGLGGAYVAWAAQSPRAAAIAAVPGTQVDAQFTLSIDGGTPIKSPRLIHPVGEPFALKSDSWEAEFIARPVAGGAIELASTIRREGRIVGQPVIVVEPGQPASVEVGEPGHPHFKLEATLALLPASADREPATFSLENEATYRKLLPPVYPASAIQNKIEGMVYLDVAIDADGRVTSATLDHADPPIATVLGEAATTAVKTWQFNPPMRDGKLVAGRVVVPLRFTLSDPPKTIAPSALPPGALDIVYVVGVPARP